MASASATNLATSYSSKIPFPPRTSRARETISRVRMVQNTLARDTCSSFKMASSCISERRKTMVCMAMRLESISTKWPCIIWKDAMDLPNSSRFFRAIFQGFLPILIVPKEISKLFLEVIAAKLYYSFFKFIYIIKKK